MCGIAGEIKLDQTRADPSKVHKMMDILSHRGPSGEGQWTNGSVSMGMRRLSIIDVSGGDQPLYNEDKSIAIIGNGEIYNYKELQELLRKRGHRLRTGSDIETIAHLYEDEGVKCLQRLRGMFALCLHDKKKNRVLLVRDRLGEKPIYWTKVDESLVFASEMKAIVSYPGVKKSINLQSVEQFFSFYSIPEPQTALIDVLKLDAGCYMQIDTRTGKMEIKRYWNPDDIVAVKNDDPTKKLRKVLEDVSMLTLRSDVPVGISLSGGLDSGTVLALAASRSKKNLKAFSVGYAGRPEMDEREQARELADRYGVEFIEKEISVGEMVDHFPETVYAADDPIADIASYGIYAVAQLAHKHGVPVLLGGIGGDELFWGYPWMIRAAKEAKASGYKDTLLYEKTNNFRVGKRFFSLLAPKRAKNNYGKNSLFFWRKNKKTKSDVAFGRFAIDSVRDLWLKNDCIVLGDRMSMAASVELRLPLVDFKLTETVYENKQTITAFSRDQKYFLKESMKDLLPDNLLERKKRGFTPPVKEWVYEILTHYMRLLDDGYVVSSGLFDSTRIWIIRKTWRMMPFFWYHIYSLLVLEVWCRLYILGQDPKNLHSAIPNR